MAVVGGALLEKFIGTSEAEKAFQPWWDTVEDFLVYGLIMLGKKVLTMDIKIRCGKYQLLTGIHFSKNVQCKSISRIGCDANYNVQ